MEFLLDNPLATMDGIIFLILYSFVIFFSLVGLGYFKDRIDRSDMLATPAIPPNPDPFETAYLRGGENELARTLVFALRQKGLIVIANGNKKAYLRPALDSSSSGLSDIERHTLDWIGAERDVKDIFSGRASLVEGVARWRNLYQLQLEQRQLLMTSESMDKIRRWKWISAAVIAGLGGYKFLTALANGNWNIIFTILLLTGGLIGVLTIGRTRRRTKLGDIYLDRLRTVFQPVRRQAIEDRDQETGPVPTTRFASVDPLLVAVGVYGTAAIAGSLYPDYDEAFKKNQQNESAAGGGCGGGCGTGSSDSSSSCGSSCSSGGSSCGGGGCGGCGGGGCGS